MKNLYANVAYLLSVEQMRMFVWRSIIDNHCGNPSPQLLVVSEQIDVTSILDCELFTKFHTRCSAVVYCLKSYGVSQGGYFIVHVF